MRMMPRFVLRGLPAPEPTSRLALTWGDYRGRYAAYWRRLAASGIAGVFADHPDLARAALGRAEPVGARA